MELKVTRYEVEAGVAVVTLDRPDRLNAWTNRMHAEYQSLLEQADADASVRAIVVTGAGQAFCAGGDFRALDRVAGEARYDVDGVGGELRDFSFPWTLSTPVIAAINGPAAGAGLCLALFADVRFAAAGAKLTTSFARLGLPAEHGLAWLLPRLVGPARAADMLLSARVVLAEEALELGLVNRVLPPDQVFAAAVDYARGLAAELSPTSMRAIKEQLYRGLDWDLPTAMADGNARRDELVAGPDFREATAALREKRPPNFA